LSHPDAANVEEMFNSMAACDAIAAKLGGVRSGG
jgi:hypothetical protein